ncbi:MAG: SIR2 family protein [Rhodobacter sp.]|nr:SIR2 family protein [Rhodobacter sp.]
MPVKFEIAQQLHRQLRKHGGLFVDEEALDTKAKDAVKAAWPGALMTRESAAPTYALRLLKRVVGRHWAKITPYNDFQEKWQEFHSLMSRSEAGRSFEGLAKTLLVDECPHAMLLLRRGLLKNIDIDPEEGENPSPELETARKHAVALERALDLFNEENLKRDLDGIRERPRRYRVLTPFKFDKFEKIRNSADAKKGPNAGLWGGFTGRLETRLDDYQKRWERAGDKRIYLTPMSRFLVPLYLSLCDDPFKALAATKGKIRTSEFFAEPKKEDFSSRRSIIADRFDPLPKAVLGLGIDRYITTNYDFEIERFFQDRGYRNFPPGENTQDPLDGPQPERSPDDFRSDGIGGVLRDYTFERETAADLTAFMIEASPQDAGVFHLHGRATENDPLVITERDYMKLYLTQDEYRDTVDEGINIAFSGAPLLFLGLGMGETDLLRPLRQFISNRDRTIGYTSLALLPADGPLEARTKFSSALYLRYGVYTIFYGSGFIKIKGKKRGIDWLHRILTLIKALGKELTKWEADERPEKRRNDKIALDLFKALREVGADLADAEDGYPKTTSALAVLYGGEELYREDKAGLPEMDPEEVPQDLLDRMEDKKKCRLRCCRFSPTRPRRGMSRTQHYDEDTFIKGKQYLGFFTDLLDQVVKAILRFDDEMPQGKDDRKKALAPFRIALDGLHGAFVTGSLNASLDGIAAEQKSWWKKWQESPPHRKAAFQRLPPAKKFPWDPKGRAYAHDGKAIFVRHQVDNVITPTPSDDDGVPDYGADVVQQDVHGNWRVKWEYATRIRAFDTFIAAAESTLRGYGTHYDVGRRRIITVAAHRGLGKGTFMSAFSTPRGQALYRNAVWPKSERGAVTFVAQVFVNLGFSPEIASVYDMLAHSLVDAIGFLRQARLLDQARAIVAALRSGANAKELARDLAADGQQIDPALVQAILRRNTAFADSEFARILRKPDAYPGREHLSRDTFELSWAVAITQLIDGPEGMEVARLRELFLEARLSELPAEEEQRDAKREEYWSEIAKLEDDAVRDLFRDRLQVFHRDALQAEINDLSRLNGLELLFHRFRDTSRALSSKPDDPVAAETPRFLFNLYAIELLFDGSRRAKNGEIHRLLDLFFGERIADCPVDFVFVGDENGLGAPWSAPVTGESQVNAGQFRLRMDRENLPPGGEEQIQHRLSVGHIQLEAPGLMTRPHGPEYHKNAHFVHFARPVNPVSLLVDNFRMLAMAFYLVNPPPVPELSKDDAKAKLRGAKKLFAEAVRLARGASDSLMGHLWIQKDLPTKDQLREARELGRLLTTPSQRTLDLENPEIAGQIETAQSAIDEAIDELKEHAKLSELKDVAGDLDAILRTRLQRTNPVDGREWHIIRHRMGASRIALTQLLAACEHIVIHAPNAAQGGEDAQSFIRSTVEAVRTVGQNRRDQMVLTRVIDLYQRYHKIGHPDLDSELHAIILRHLGVIGTPISSAVLVRLPEFRQYFQRVGIEPDMSRRRFLVRALTVLAYRGLVFRLDPHPQVMVLGQDHDDWDDDKEYRYALHRIVQNHAISKLDPNIFDPIKSNLFAPTVYSSLPSSGTQLTRDSYRFLRSLMIGLSQYPDVPQNELGIEPWLFTTRSHAVRAQAVRAALTLARSTFSVAVISRLADQRPIGEGVEKRGHLETYRVRLRWIVRMAWELFQKPEPVDGKPDWYREDGDFDQVCALYRDEIVWLYNELGVISLVQGSLTDALGFLRQAFEFNERIEGRSHDGAISHHINLNHAIVQIERGRLPSARNRLNLIREATKARAWTLHHTAKGYLCVLDHITGRTDELKERFRKITDFFQEHHDSRAAAVFLNHRGRFLIAEDRDEAARCIEDARDMADTGGHEDLRHHIELSLIKLRLWKHQHQVEEAPPLAHSENLRELTAVEAYARRMGIWSLQCDALRIRAEFLLLQGETTTAGKLLTRSMAICRRNTMRLRLNNALTIYAKTLFHRGDLMSARRMARLSLNYAKALNYNLETPRVQELMRQLDHGA